jgi:enoyl-CoA hydratase
MGVLDMSSTEVSAHPHLRLENRGPIAILSVDRPEVLNALNRDTLRQLDETAARLLDDGSVGALIVTGAGEKSFVSGADIGELAALDARGLEELSRYGQSVCGRLARSPKPVIAAVNGFAFGGGCGLALACHLRIASQNAVLGLPEVKLGIIPGYGGTQRLPRLIGMGRAIELILSGRPVKAEEAERIGLVSLVVPREQLIDEAEKLALTILKNGPLAVASALEAVGRGGEMSLDDALRLESALFGLLGASEDSREGFKAFLEKRPARFVRR